MRSRTVRHTHRAQRPDQPLGYGTTDHADLLSLAPERRISRAAALRAAFPNYTFNVIVTYGKRKYEAVANDGGSPCCLISTRH
jgi:hypothetical protein